MIDEDACQAIADGALDQRGSHRGVHAAGQPADRVTVTDRGANLLDQRVGDVRRRPRRADARELVQEPAEHLLAVRRVHDLGVVLHARELSGPVLERRNGGAGAGGDDLEPVGRGRDRVAVAHPHRLPIRKIRMKLSPRHIQLGAAVLTGAGAGDRAAEGLGHRLEAVADAEDGNVEIEQRGVELGSTVGVDAGGPARQHDRLRVSRLDLVDGRGMRDHLREHPRLTDAPCDELRVLRAEVDHEDGAGCCGFHLSSLVARFDLALRSRHGRLVRARMCRHALVVRSRICCDSSSS